MIVVNATQVVFMWSVLHVVTVEKVEVSLKQVDLNTDHIKVIPTSRCEVD